MLLQVREAVDNYSAEPIEHDIDEQTLRRMGQQI